jgi:hypothetical protein
MEDAPRRSRRALDAPGLRAHTGLRLCEEGIMRIRIWNAFASNNSGSYTIVGSFPTRELASEIAAELAELMSAHTAWLEVETGKRRYPLEGESPLQAFVKKHDLTWHANMGATDDWPRYGGQDGNVPKAFAVGHEVVIHHDFTVTMPRVFGEYFYARGGRVSLELDHAHHPIVGLVELWVPSEEREGVDIPAKVSAILEELNADDGPLVTHVPHWHQPAWQVEERFGEFDLTVGAVFDDLLRGFTAVERIAAAHGLRAQVRLFEAFGKADSLAFLRPSWPPLRRRLCSVVLEAAGKPAPLRDALEVLLHDDDAAVTKVLASVPVTVMSGLVRARAEKAAALLREAGATVVIQEEPPEA